MLVFFIYDTSSCTIFNREDKNVPSFEKQELGRYVVNLDPLHLSKELRWVDRKLKRLGCTKAYIRQRVCEQVAHGLRAKEHLCVEI
jgi:hypothetical protein